MESPKYKDTERTGLMELTGLQIFKYLPSAKKLPDGNCKKCGFPTCMAFALKLAKKQTDIEKCPHIPEELKEKFLESTKIQQYEIKLNENTVVGGETVMFRHDKTFVNKTALFIKIDTTDKDFDKILSKITAYSIDRVGETFKVDGLYLVGKNEKNIEKALHSGFALIREDDPHLLVKGKNIDELVSGSKIELKNINKKLILYPQIEGKTVQEVIEELTQIRRQAILKRFEPLAFPTMVKIPQNFDSMKTCAFASMLICRYASIVVLNSFDEALLASLFTLRQNIYTNPQKPLQVESKVYEFNEPDENAIVLMTTNFALTYFAVANELESIPLGSYLIVTPSDGMSVLTAWSADKFNAEIVAKMMSKTDLASKVKKREIIIPGLLSHMKEELETALPDWKIVVGTIEAFQLYDFIKKN